MGPVLSTLKLRIIFARSPLPWRVPGPETQGLSSGHQVQQGWGVGWPKLQSVPLLPRLSMHFDFSLSPIPDNQVGSRALARLPSQ